MGGRYRLEGRKATKRMGKEKANNTIELVISRNLAQPTVR